MGQHPVYNSGQPSAPRKPANMKAAALLLFCPPSSGVYVCIVTYPAFPPLWDPEADYIGIKYYIKQHIKLNLSTT